MSPTVHTQISQAGPDHFRMWRDELGKTTAEMAALAGVTLAQYSKAEETSNIPANIHVKVLTAFKKVGKTPTVIETSKR